MNTQLGWEEVAARLALTLVAGTVVGLNRAEHGRAAGLRTTMLVCLAAAVSMIQTNLLLASAGKAGDSFISLDLMRLPLGVLTGMGFIGGGAILRRGDVVVGLTTAATLWYVTILGLCFGGGQLVLGLVALGVGMVILSSLKQWETRMPQDQRGVLTVEASRGGTTEDEFLQDVRGRGFLVKSTELTYDNTEERWILRCDVKWRARPSNPPRIPMKEWSALPGVRRVEWRPFELSDAGR